MNKTDLLALERTKLANERTFLAYFRTFVVVFGSGLTLVKVDFLNNLESLGYLFMGLAILLFLVGVIRFFVVKKRLDRWSDE
ncbi:MAG: DUF202 domain-containing protein [Cytophagales bacterium]|nr:DUF202 domain-containing protein [Cytophagales bacterium]